VDARAALLEGRSHECYLTDQIDAAIETLEHAVALRHAIGDRRGEGAALSLLSRRLWCGARSADATLAARKGLRLLEGLPPGRDLALAYGIEAAGHLNDERFDDAVAWVDRALELATDLDDAIEVTVYCLNILGTTLILAGRPGGWEKLERSLALAERAGLDEDVGRAFIHIGWAMTRTRAYDRAPLLDRGVKLCDDLGLEGWKYYVVAYRARLRLDSGEWDGAADDAAFVLRSARSVPLLRILALTILGLLRARRGDPEQWPPLDEALRLLQGQDELQYHAPVAAARAEAAWLDGRGVVDDLTRHVLDLAVERRSHWVVGELAWLRRLAGVEEATPATVGPYASQLAGDTEAAAARWVRMGCPYDAALARAGSDGEVGLRLALSEFQRLGARPAAAIVARRLREHGARGLPRGPRPQTMTNPARLTGRESEVLALIGLGMSNAEIAARLHLAEKTVHHHVSAILRKLGVGSRGRAVSEAVRLGLTPGPHGAADPGVLRRQHG
jgi:DNA-binding CsgD family transcriptional regulator